MCGDVKAPGYTWCALLLRHAECGLLGAFTAPTGGVTPLCCAVLCVVPSACLFWSAHSLLLLCGGYICRAFSVSAALMVLLVTQRYDDVCGTDLLQSMCVCSTCQPPKWIVVWHWMLRVNLKASRFAMMTADRLASQAYVICSMYAGVC